jgi:hypothetical protein
MNTLFVTGMRLGDSLHVLPIASWFCKTNNTKIDWAVANELYSLPLEEILLKQTMIENVTRFDYGSVKEPIWPADAFSCHRPYHHVERMLNHILGSKYNQIYSFGYDKRAYQEQKIESFPLHLAQEYNFGVDYDYTLEFGVPDSTYKNQTVIIDKIYRPQLQNIRGVQLDDKTPIIKNIQYAAGAQQVITMRTGAAIFLSLARIPYSLVCKDNDLAWYLKMCHEINGGITPL